MAAEPGEDEHQLLAANETFYRAFRERDLATMERLWAEVARVTCAHPGKEVLVGRDAVLDSFRALLAASAAPSLVCDRPVAHILGGAAYVTCYEGASGESPVLLATNVFTREEGRWRLVHHHAGPLSPSVRLSPIQSTSGRVLN